MKVYGEGNRREKEKETIKGNGGSDPLYFQNLVASTVHV